MQDELCEGGSADPSVWRRAGQGSTPSRGAAWSQFTRKEQPEAGPQHGGQGSVGPAGLRQDMSPGCLCWKAHVVESSRVYLC